MKKNKIIFHFTNGEKYEINGYLDILLDYLRSEDEYGYIFVNKGMYIMKNNINYIKIEDIEEESEEK